MALFKRKSSEKNLVSTENGIQISKKSSLYKTNLWEHIPQNIREILFISDAAPNDINLGFAINISVDLESGRIDSDEVLPDDPSTIYINLPLSESDIDPEKPPYWPAYAKLSPEQRWKYITWLSDITKAIDPGYVFVFYYGLERQLLLGAFEKAFEIVIKLREYHENNSFQAYSLAGLLYSCVLRNQPTFMNKLKGQLTSLKWGNEELLVKYWLNENISAEEFSRLSMGFKDLNMRYLKNENELYTKAVREVFIEKFGENSLPLNEIVNYKSVKRKKSMAYANFSFPENVRFIDTPMLFEDKALKKTVSDIHNASHEMVKNELKDLRKRNAT